GGRPAEPPADSTVVPAVAISPYQNVRPEVGYIGDAACAACHRAIAESYRRHPMGQDLSLMSDLAAREHYGPEAHNPFEKFGCRFRVERRDGRVFHTLTCPGGPGGSPAGREDEVLVAIGSGARGRSYVINRDGYLFQS